MARMWNLSEASEINQASAFGIESADKSFSDSLMQCFGDSVIQGDLQLEIYLSEYCWNSVRPDFFDFLKKISTVTFASLCHLKDRL